MRNAKQGDGLDITQDSSLVYVNDNENQQKINRRSLSNK